MPDNRKGRNELMDSVALLVVDAQDSFIDTLHNKEEFLIRTAFAIEAARCLKIHTLFTEQAADKLGPTNPRLLSLAGRPKVFHKRCFSALAAPGIEQYLREREIYHLLVVGLETPVCVYQTGLQAADEDIDITFLTDAISARRKEDEAPVIDELRRQGCHFLPSETVFYSLLRDVTNPYFRVFNGLVKSYGDKVFDAEEFKSAAPKSEADTEIEDQEESQLSEPRGSETEERDQSANKRRRRPRRRRGRGDDRAREAQDSSQQERAEKPSDAQQTSTSRIAPSSEETAPEAKGKERRPRRRHSTERPVREPAESPAPVVDSFPAKETHSDSDTTPAKRAAKKAARKTPAKKGAKKAAKKVAKKAAKKVARKTARKTTETDSSD